MMPSPSPLTLLAFPQHWDAEAGLLRLRWLCVPSLGPLTPLGAGLPSFADANLQFEACLIGGLAHLPRSADVGLRLPLVPAAPPLQKAALFAELATLIAIDPAAPPPDAASPRFRKAATASYRALAGSRPLGEHLADGDAFDCALHEAHAAQPPAPLELPATLRWGELLALALRQPRLAEELGLIGEATIVPDADVYARGGWLHVALSAAGDGAGVPGLALSYAARLPPLAATRPLYAAVLFPLDPPDGVLDDIERDAQRYDHGHARLVHGAQDGEHGSDARSGDAIRLAWDDEQVAQWLNRQEAPDNAAPMGTAGFRIDVRPAGGDQPWQSLQRMRSLDELRVGALSIGPWEGEGRVEVVPVGLDPARPAEYWMPRYFAAWRGSSLVLADADLARLHRRADLPFDAASAALRLTRERCFEPVADRAVPLRYGERYEFRVRLADLSGGGPGPDAPLPEAAVPPARDEHYTTTIHFRRRRPPGPVAVLQRPARDDLRLVVERPLLDHPDILFTSAAPSFADLEAALEADIAAGTPRGLALPDPDVVALEVLAEVRALAGDGAPWQRLYEVRRAFDADPLALEVALVDIARLADLPDAVADDAALPLPTARDLRLTLRAIGRDEADYFVDADARRGAAVTVELHALAGAEPGWAGSAPLVRSFFFRLPPPDGSVPRPAERLAQELHLVHHDLTLAGPAGQRTLFGCSAALRHTLAPEGSALTLSSDADATQQWINALRVTLARDWSWRGLAPTGIEVQRRVQRGDADPGASETVGTIRLPAAVAAPALALVEPGAARDPLRQFSELVFFDALDPKPGPGEFPTELTLGYTLMLHFEDGSSSDPLEVPAITLPVTTPPAQVPQLRSAGIALTPYAAADDYSSSAPRRRRLWFEFVAPPADPGDAYFVRVLAVSPDPLLTRAVIPELVPEPPLPIDPEWVRLIDVGQSRDESGARAMQAVWPHDGADAAYAMVPLPDGLGDSSPELFGLFTYEIRLGHADGRWCTAHGRYGPPLRVAGVQHPPPPLQCLAARSGDALRVRAAYALPVHDGVPLRPSPPMTRLWALLYARVRRGDGQAWRNLLLWRTPLEAPLPPPVFGVVMPSVLPPVLLGEGRFALDEVQRRLRLAGLAADAPLTAMVVELHGEPEIEQPLGRELAHARLLRASPLVAVPDAC